MTEYGKGRSQCGAALALVLPPCAAVRPLCAVLLRRGASHAPPNSPPALCGCVAATGRSVSPKCAGEPGGRKMCRIKAGGRFRAHLPLTPPRNAGRGREPGWSVCPSAGCGRWSETKITEKKPPGFSLSQGGCAGWFSQEMEEFDYEKKTGSFSGTGWPR